MSEQAKLIQEYQQQFNEKVNENENLKEENKALSMQNTAMKERIEELKILEDMNLERESIQPRLDQLKQQEEKLTQR